MNRKEKEALHRTIARLHRAQELVQKPALPSESERLVKVELLIEDAVAEVRTLLGIPRWPEPTVDPPDMATLEEWLWAEGGCEASDGCWCEPDAVCPHGHPSCAPRSVPTESSREEPKNGVS